MEKLLINYHVWNKVEKLNTNKRQKKQNNHTQLP